MSKEDTKWRLRDAEGKEYIIIDSEKVDLQVELNKTIVKQMKEIERLKEKIIKLEEEPLTNKISRIDSVVSNIYKDSKEKEGEIEKLKNGLHKLLELNHYMMHCSSKRVIDKLILKQWYLIYETLGEQTPGIVFASKGGNNE